MRIKRKNRPQAGFTLIELAVVLIVIGAIIAAGASYIQTSVKSSKQENTARNVSKIAEAIKGYAQTHMYLPDEEQLKNSVSSPKDPFGNEYIYYYASGMSLPEGGFTGRVPDYICTVGSSNMSVRICFNDDCSDGRTIDNVSFAVGSKGINNREEAEKSEENGRILLKVFAGRNSDDVIRWVTVEELKGDIGCQYNGSGLKILNSEVAPIKVDNYGDNGSSVRIFADSAGGGYEWCVDYYGDETAKNTLIFTAINGAAEGPVLRADNSCDTQMDFTKGDALAVKINAAQASGKVPVSIPFKVYVKDKNGGVTTKRFVQSLY